LKRLLLVTYFHPPLGGPGVFRPLRLCRYLPGAGWDVTVLTVRDDVRVLKDRSLLGDVPEGTRVERTASVEPRTMLIALNRLGLGALSSRIQDWFLVPDDQRGWVPFAVRRGRRILRDVRHDAVLSTSAPYSAHLVGRGVARATGAPWVADFRDEWTTNPYLVPRYPTAWHRRLNRDLERSVLREANAVVSVSRPWLDAHRSLVPEQPAEKFHVLPNGFDPAHFPDRPAAVSDRFRILYTGMFYGHRSPAAFLEGLRRALARGWIPAAGTEVLFIGHGSTAHGVPDLPTGVLRAIEHRPYAETLEWLGRAAVLLLVVPPEGGPGNHTGKLFPYLACGRPILVQAPEPNVAADVVRESRSGVVVPPDDPERAAEALRDLHARWKSGVLLPDRDPDVVNRFRADVQARDWAALLDGIVRSD